MDFLGIGLSELGLILVIILIVMGPKDMVGTARRIARTIRAITHSEFWQTTREAWKMARDLPTELLRESGLNETRAELEQMGTDLNQWKREVDLSLRPDANRDLPPARPAEAAPQPQTDADSAGSSLLEANPGVAEISRSGRTDE